jgi:hypothetical protein
MAEHVVEDVGFLKIIKLIGASYELSGREPAVGQMVEEHRVRDQARHRHHGPAGQPLQLLVDPREVGDTRPVQVQRVQALEERIASASRQQSALALVQRDPDIVLGLGIALPALVDGPVGARARRRNKAQMVGHARRMTPVAGKFRSELAAKAGSAGKIMRR